MAIIPPNEVYQDVKTMSDAKKPQEDQLCQVCKQYVPSGREEDHGFGTQCRFYRKLNVYRAEEGNPAQIGGSVLLISRGSVSGIEFKIPDCTALYLDNSKIAGYTRWGPRTQPSAPVVISPVVSKYLDLENTPEEKWFIFRLSAYLGRLTASRKNQIETVIIDIGNDLVFNNEGDVRPYPLQSDPDTIDNLTKAQEQVPCVLPASLYVSFCKFVRAVVHQVIKPTNIFFLEVYSLGDLNKVCTPWI